MAVIRVVKNKNYTVMSNYHLDDERLSLKAKGLLSMMLRLPDDWDYTIEGLAKRSKDAKAAVTSGIKELESYGYIRRTIKRDAAGHISGTDYTVYEVPMLAGLDENPDSENRIQAKEADEGTPASTCREETGIPESDFPATENPPAENRTQLNTVDTKYLVPPKAPQRGRASDPLFEQFWAAWPRSKRKTAKDKARRAWRRLCVDQPLADHIMAALEGQKKDRDWIKEGGAYIPMPSTWLNQRRWEVEDGPVPSDTAGATVVTKRRATQYELVETPDGRLMPYWELPPENIEQYDDHGLTAWRWRDGQ